MYQFTHNNSKFYVECERHSYRVRLYLIEVKPTGNFVVNGLGEQCEKTEWVRHGYIGSWYPATKKGGYADSVSSFDATSRTRKAVARECLVNFMDNVLQRDHLEVRSW